MSSVTPRPAATVILMREKAGRPIETFLLKRHEASAFMGGNFVYPGGRLEQEDSDVTILPCCRGFDGSSKTVANEGYADKKEALAYRICALRELFEEAGILLARDTSGEQCASDSPPGMDRFASCRHSVETKEMSMIELAQREQVVYALDQLLPFDRWITPEARNIRFDTRFFLAFCPEGQEASSDQRETVQGMWMSPLEAVEANLTGAIALSPPATETLEMISPYQSKASLLEFLQKRKPRTVLPILTKTADGPVILFPWDEEYGMPEQATIMQPGKSRLRYPGEKMTRVLMKDGRWLPCVPEKASL